MKRVLKGMVVIAASMGIIASPLTAEARELYPQEPKQAMVVEVDGLFGTKYVVNADVTVRSGPGYSYDSVGKLYKFDVVTIKSIDNGWAKFKYSDSQIRYIPESYIDKK